MAIKCGHCGNRHASIVEVRQCAPTGGGVHKSVWTARFQAILSTATSKDAESMMNVLKWVFINRPDIARGSAAMHQAAVLLYTRAIGPTRALQANFS